MEKKRFPKKRDRASLRIRGWQEFLNLGTNLISTFGATTFASLVFFQPTSRLDGQGSIVLG